MRWAAADPSEPLIGLNPLLSPQSRLRPCCLSLAFPHAQTANNRHHHRHHHRLSPAAAFLWRTSAPTSSALPAREQHDCSPSDSAAPAGPSGRPPSPAPHAISSPRSYELPTTLLHTASYAVRELLLARAIRHRSRVARGATHMICRFWPPPTRFYYRLGRKSLFFRLPHERHSCSAILASRATPQTHAIKVQP